MFVIIKLYTFKLYSVNKKKNNIYSMEDSKIVLMLSF